MAIERGLIISGLQVPETDWCIRDPNAWWRPGERGTRRRADTIDLLVGHHTGGEAGLRHYDDDGPFVVRGMKSRTRPDGTLMEVAIHFVIGACDEGADFAGVWQCADPGLTACCHLSRAVNPRSIGVEVVSAGMPGPLDTRDRPVLSVPLLGRMRNVLAFYPGQLSAWQRLAQTLAGVSRAGIAIPPRVPSFGAWRRFTLAEQKRWSGCMEHTLSPSTTKLDAGGMLIGALADAGWEKQLP